VPEEQISNASRILTFEQFINQAGGFFARVGQQLSDRMVPRKKGGFAFESTLPLYLAIF
jgi:hypothetical protein